MPKVDASGAVELDKLDWKLPLSTLLKVGTAVAHETTENTKGASMLAHGQLDKDEYVRYLIMLWHVYE
jgi:heme oxygenase (biliverdin-producing, ferredoxin)